MIENYPSLFSAINTMVCLGVYVLFLTPKQLREVTRPADGLTELRKIILAILLISIFTSVPGLMYSAFRAFGYDYGVLRSVATVLTSISKDATTVLLVLIWTYRRKDY